MRKFISITVVIEFLLWLVPLGAFIDPSKEGWVCGGGRAICLCHLIPKRQGSGTVFKSNSETQKEKLNPSSNHYLLLARTLDLKNIREFFTLNQNQSFFNLLVTRSVDHVPKI